MSSTLTVDRIEGEMVIIETPVGSFDLPISCFDWPVSEGDRIVLHKQSQSENELQKSLDRLNRLTSRNTQSDIIDL